MQPEPKPWIPSALDSNSSAIDSDRKYLVISGNRGAGKSENIRRAIARHKSENKNAKILIVKASGNHEII